MNGEDVTNYANLVSSKGTKHAQTPSDVVVENSVIQTLLHKTRGTAFIAPKVEYEVTVTSVWPQTKEVVPLLMAVISYSPKKEGTACNATDQIFVLDQDGVIHHKCSKKVVCPQDNNPTYYKKLMLKDKCDLSISRHMRLPAHNNLKNLKHNFCVHPNGGWPGEGVYLNYWPGCGEERLKLNFFKLGAASA